MRRRMSWRRMELKKEDGGVMAAAKALTIKQPRKDMYVSTEYAAHFHVKVEGWKDRDEIVPRERETWQFVRKKREGRKHWTERCKDLGGEVKCMRCGKREKKENISGYVPWRQVDGENIQQHLQKHRASSIMVVHDLQRIVDANGRIPVWCN